MSKYNNELHKHKAADTIKWIVAFVLIIAIMGAVVCLALQVSGVFDFFKKDDVPVEEIESSQDEGDLHFDIQNSAPSISPVDGIRGVSLALATTAAEDMYSKTLTATVQPQDAPDKKVDWSIVWTNVESMPTENVSEYLSVTPTSDGSLTAAVKCLKAFPGKSIDVIVTTRMGGFSAVCKVTYTGHPESISVAMTGATKKSDSGWGVEIYEFESTKTYDFALSVDNKFHSVGASVAYEIESVTAYGSVIFDWQASPAVEVTDLECELKTEKSFDETYYAVYCTLGSGSISFYSNIQIQDNKLHITSYETPGAIDKNVSQNGGRFSGHAKFKKYKDSTKVPYVSIKIKEKNSGVTYTLNIRAISSITGVSVSSSSIDF